MSRIGKKPIAIPEGVSVSISDRTIKVKGQKGELSWNFPENIGVSITDGLIKISRTSDLKTDRALHGLTRSLISNMITGVSKGYQKNLEIAGVGYRAQVSGNKITFTLGYSHPIEMQLPEGISAAVDPKQVQITLTGIDKQLLGQVAASMRALRPPDAYKGKGIRYAGQRLKLKVGKAGKK
ncbi:MAG: 50S ribosomal protein L6 [Nitrospirae bacterium]|nr:50S ribosomal protein L6 [Nitrospirota bacterium]